MHFPHALHVHFVYIFFGSAHFTESGVRIHYALPVSRMTSKFGKEWGFSGAGKDCQSVRSVAIMLQLRRAFRNARFFNLT